MARIVPNICISNKDTFLSVTVIKYWKNRL